MFERRFKALLLLYLRRCVEDLALQLGLLESPLDSSPTLRDLRALSLSLLVYKKRPLSRVQVSQGPCDQPYHVTIKCPCIPAAKSIAHRSLRQG